VITALLVGTGAADALPAAILAAVAAYLGVTVLERRIPGGSARRRRGDRNTGGAQLEPRTR